MYLSGCFWMHVTFKSVDKIKQISLPNVGGPCPISWRPEQTKKSCLPQEQGDSLADDHQTPSTSSALLGLHPVSPHCRSGPVSLHNHEPIPYDKSLSLHIHILLILFLWSCSVAKSCRNLCIPVDCSTPGFPVLH